MTETIPSDLVTALNRLAETYGPGTVRNAALTILQSKIGRPALYDFAWARPWFLNDALAWISDAVRSRYYRGQHMEEPVRMAAWWSDYLDMVRQGGEVVAFPAVQQQ